ncbi:hypothetical protein [Pseudonocardia sp.]|uniref:DUF6197 family protein n=1 Tax=Pseudonocardia sp. TaxID=60912 RepID=UPI0031FD695D
MTIELSIAPPQQARPVGGRLRWRKRRRERQRLARQDRLAAHLAELHRIRALVSEARAVIESGWVQHGWFACRDAQGRQHTVNAGNLRSVDDLPVTGACLVGAIVRAGGGLAAVGSQHVQRALDLTWHTLYGDDREPVRWCPAPPIRSAKVRDLTRWNDQPERTPEDVMALLHAVERAAGAELGRARA